MDGLGSPCKTPHHGMKKNTEILGQDAAFLSICEVGLGSLLHGLKVPLSGYLLSLNQTFLLARSVFKTRDRTAAVQISAVAAVLKSLSPAGKKLTPMLAISAQGFLFSLGNLFFGANLLGSLVGGAVSSTWSFLQPLLIYYLIFGHNLVSAADYFLRKMSESFETLPLDASDLVAAAAALICLKAVFAMGLVILARYLPETRFQKFQKRLLSAAEKAKADRGTLEASNPRLSASARAAAKDLLNPLFLVSFVLTVAFFVFVEASFSQVFWAALRPLAVGFLLFLGIRMIPFARLEGHNNTFSVALTKVRKFFVK